jgi:hypothetical protein
MRKAQPREPADIVWTTSAAELCHRGCTPQRYERFLTGHALRQQPLGRLRRVLPRPAPGGAAVLSTQHPVMDWLRKGGSYFQTTLETDMWNMPSGEQPVHFWREPLSALCAAATDAGFLIENSSSRSQQKRCASDIPRTTSS